MNKNLIKYLPIFILCLIVPIVLFGCDNSKNTENNTEIPTKKAIVANADIGLDADINGTKFPTNKINISTDVYLNVGMTFDNKNAEDCYISVEIFIDNAKYITTTTIGGDVMPQHEYSNNGKVLRFYDIKFLLQSGKTTRALKFLLRANKPCEGMIRIEYTIEDGTPLADAEHNPYLKYEFAMPSNSQVLGTPVLRLDGNNILWNQSLNHNGFYYRICKSIQESGDDNLRSTEFPKIDISSLDAGDYYIYVFAKGDGHIYLDSQEACLHIQILEKVDITLDKASGIISWDPVDGATSYEVKIGESSYIISETRYQLSLKANESINVEIIASSNKQNIRQTSATFAIDKLKTPTILRKGPYLKWNNVDADCDINIYIDGELVESIPATTEKYMLKSGEYDVYIVATKNSKYTLNSDVSNIEHCILG